MPAWSQDEGPSGVRELTPDVEARIEKGLAYLESIRGEDGSFGDSYRLASTSLAGLAFLAGGSSYDRGPHQESIQRAVRWILEACTIERGRSGVLLAEPRSTQGRMHSHGYALLFLTQVHGSIPAGRPVAREVEETIRGALQLSLEAQTAHGGWGYYFRDEPRWGTDEASTTITQVQALRGARDAGFQTSTTPEAIRDAIDYVKKSQKADGSIMYSRNPPEPKSTYELTAAAVSTLNASGEYHSDELDKGLSFMRKAIREAQNPAKAARNWYYYGNLYAAQAMFQASDADWRFWFLDARDDILAQQNPTSGSWSSDRGFGNAYSTAVCLIILQMPYRYLPIFQR